MRKAILIVHGFGGGVYDEEYLATELEFIKDYDVFSFTLPGHDTMPGKYTREDWINCSCEHLENLINHGYKTIYVIGHSMGGVIATYLASKYKEVKKLVLAAPAFHYLKFKDNKPDIINSIKFSPEVIKEYKADVILNRIFLLPKNAIKEFMHLISEYYDSPRNVSIPTLIIIGSKDNIVPFSSARYVNESLLSKDKELLLVKGINHDIFRSKRKDEVTLEIIDFLKNGVKGEVKKEI